MLIRYAVYGFGAATALVNYIAQVDPTKAFGVDGDCRHIGDFYYCSGTVDEL